MKVALIGDIHANLPALEAVLEDAHKRGVEAIWNVGDMLGYGAFPDEVVDLLQKENVQSIIGNYDIKVMKVKQKRNKWKKNVPPEKWVAFNWTYNKLSKSNLEYLNSLNKELRMEMEGKRILIMHGTPDSDEEHVTNDTTEDRLNEIALMADADLIIFGHSHIPFKRKVGSVWFINPGSVGRPDDGDPKASYAILVLRQPNVFRVDHYRVEYDVERAVSAIREGGLPDLFARMIQQGHSFETIQKEEQPKDDNRLKASVRLAESCGYEEGHTHQVARLALNLFDELQQLHQLGPQERFLLHNAAILHDIGWIEGQKKHHKTALRLILEDKALLFSERESLIVGSVARYHRAALPKMKHSHFSSLEPTERKMVEVLASILRIADGLDRTHQSIVNSVSCEITMDRIIVRCNVMRPSEADRQAALDKGQLMRKVFKKKLSIEWKM
jgi:putative phosphoesterase